MYALVIYARAAADRGGVTIEQAVRELAVRHGLVDEVDQRVRADAHNGR